MTDEARWQIVIDLPDGWTRFAAQQLLEELGRNQINRPWKPEIRKVRPGKLRISDLVTWAMMHESEHPGHGINCIHADPWIGRTRDETTVPEGPLRAKAQRRLDWILKTALRRHP